MGNGYAANKHGISSAGVYHGTWVSVMLAWLSVFFLLAGCWSAAREKRALILLCGGIILAPILMSLQGISVNTSAFARYLICSLPLLLIVMAAGIDWLARLVWMRRSAAMTAWGLATLIVACWTPNIRGQFLIQKQWPLARWLGFCMRKWGQTT